MSWSFVQGAATGATGTSISKAFTSNVTAGNLMVVVFGSYGLAADPTISDTLGSSWTKAVSNASKCVVFFAKVPSTGANTVTLSCASDFIGLAICEYSFAGATGYTADGTQTAQGDTSSASSGSVPVSGSNELVICGFAQAEGVITHTPGTGFTQGAAFTNGANDCGAYQDYALNVSTAQTDASTFSSWTATGGTNDWHSASVSIQATTSGGGGGGLISGSSGPSYAGSASASGAGPAWSNPANATGSPDGLYATVSPVSTASNYLFLTNFMLGIPSSATINGLEIESYAHQSGGATLNAYITLDGINSDGLSYSVTPGASDSWQTIGTGSSSSVFAGLSLTPAQVNASTFGVIFYSTVGSMYLDSVRITVWYTAPAPLSKTFYFIGQAIVTSRFW